MKTVIAYKENGHFNIASISGFAIDGQILREKAEPFIQMKNDIILASTDGGRKASALSVFESDGTTDDPPLTKEEVVMGFVPVLVDAFHHLDVDLSVDNENYISMKSQIIMMQKDKAFYIDQYLNVYEIKDYLATGDFMDIYNLELKNSSGKYSDAIKAAYERIISMCPNHGSEIVRINGDTMEREVL